MTEPIIELLRQVWDDIAVLGGELRDEEWGLPTDCPGWTVRDHVAHMVGTEQMLLGRPAPEIELGDAPHVRNDIGRFNEQWVVAYRSRPPSEALADFRAVTQERLAALRALSPAQWDEEGFTPEGPGPYRQFMQIRVFDCWFHEQDMREATGRPGSLDDDPARFCADRVALKGLPYVVGKKAAAPQGSSVVFELPDREYAIGVDGRAALLDAPPAAPTVRIRTDLRTFTRLGGGRWTAADARARGAVAVEGDAELADRVLADMGFTI
jgi:uncharacterized protein (TIGR03083 family)